MVHGTDRGMYPGVTVVKVLSQPLKRLRCPPPHGESRPSVVRRMLVMSWQAGQGLLEELGLMVDGDGSELQSVRAG